MSTSFRIDPATGSVLFDGTEAAVLNNASKDSIAAALSKHLKSVQDLGNGYEWLYFHDLSFGGKPATISVCFFQGKVRELRWNTNLRPNAADNSWPTRDECNKEIEFVLGVLRSSLSRRLSNGSEKFPWGLVWCEYNERDGFASSGLRYAN